MNKFFEVRYNFYANEPDVENGPSANDIGYEVYLTTADSKETAKAEWLCFAKDEAIENLNADIIETTETEYNSYIEYQREMTEMDLGYAKAFGL
jgi:hypothetical protein